MGSPSSVSSTGSVSAGRPATLTNDVYGVKRTCCAKFSSPSSAWYHPTGRGSRASAGVMTASKGAKRAMVRRSNPVSHDCAAASSAAVRARPRLMSHRVRGSSRSARSSATTIVAAPACQMVRKAAGYPGSAAGASSSTPWPSRSSSATPASRAARAAGSSRISVNSSHGVSVITATWKRPSPRIAAPRYGPSSPGARTANGCRGGYPCGAIMPSSRSAASATVRAIGPTTPRPASRSSPDPDGTRPRDGFTPTRPHDAAGMRIEPPPSLPGANGSRPAATAAAAPPLEPPAPRSRSHGLRAGRPPTGSVYDGRPNSGVAVLPRLTAPAASTASTRSSDSSGTCPSWARDPNAVGTPARGCRSLSARGMPQSGAARGTSRSTRRARSSARSGVTAANAPTTGSSRSIRAR